MKSSLIIIILCIVSISVNAQTLFENGYIVNNNNEKIECLIKNVDWGFSPSKFNYKNSRDSEVQEGDLDSVKEFSVNNKFKYIRAKVRLDQSSRVLSELSTQRAPEFIEKTVFLKVLAEGKAILYKYEDKERLRYFLWTDETDEIIPLIFKDYYVGSKVNTNEQYKQQLFLYLNSEPISKKEIESARYNDNSLVKLFNKYNGVLGNKYINNSDRRVSDRKAFNISLRPGFRQSNLSTNHAKWYIHGNEYDSERDFRMGIEAELILPFNNNKWRVVLEPTYQQYSSSLTKEYYIAGTGIVTSKVKYNSIEVPLGLRHYFYINKNSALFINMQYLIDFPFSSNITDVQVESSKVVNKLEINTSTNFVYGGGFKHKDKYGFEVRYSNNQNILNKYTSWYSELDCLAFILSYTL